MKILGLDVSGVPRHWLTFEDAISAYAKGNVAWEYGEKCFTARGGFQKDGNQSIIELASIVAIKSESGFSMESIHKPVVLTNKTLFGRDRHICAYCGRTFLNKDKLSRDHIVPRSRGGQDVWMNVVTACKDCNCDKDDQMLSECGMQLLYAPYVPSHAEKLLLEGHNILADQMDFLKSRLGKNSRLL